MQISRPTRKPKPSKHQLFSTYLQLLLAAGCTSWLVHNLTSPRVGTSTRWTRRTTTSFKWSTSSTCTSQISVETTSRFKLVKVKVLLRFCLWNNMTQYDNKTCFQLVMNRMKITNRLFVKNCHNWLHFVAPLPCYSPKIVCWRHFSGGIWQLLLGGTDSTKLYHGTKSHNTNKLGWSYFMALFRIMKPQT